ncbi:MAG: hypothetical protein GON13_02990 [Nanoarchaeota archaeon]|nr:hypothetical protein [Nanoarchaeota archaeon]
MSGVGVFGPANKKIHKTVTVFSNKKIQFRDTGLYIYSSADGQLDIVADTKVQITSLQSHFGSSGTPIVLTAGSPTYALYTTNAGTSGSTSAESFYVKTVLTGAGQVGGRGRFHMTANVALGGWSNALKAHVEYGASGSTTGMGSALLAEMALSAGTSSGTYAPLESELVLGSGASTGTSTSFLYCNIGGADVATFDTNGFLFEIGAGVTQGSGKFFDSTVNTAGAQIDHTLKVKVDGSTMYIPLMDNADGS